MPRNKPYTDDYRLTRHTQATAVEIQPIKREDAQEVLKWLGITSDKILDEYVGILELAQEVYLRGRTVDAKSQIPSLGGQQPTDDAVAATLKPMMSLARRLDEYYRKLPQGMLLKINVPLSSNSNRPKHKLGVIIHALYKALSNEYVKYEGGEKKEKRGRKKTEGIAAINAAAHIISFVRRQAANASREDDEDTFLHQSLVSLKIPHPDPDEHRGKFEAFKSKAAALITGTSSIELSQAAKNRRV